MSSRPHSPRILLLGTHGQFNIGDELLLETFLERLGPECAFAVNSYAPADTAARLADRFDLTVFDTAGDRRELLGHLRRADVVFFAGGSIIKELYPSVGRWRYATLLMVLSIVAFSKLVVRTPVVMSNIGVGPIDHAFGRLLAGLIVRLTDMVSVRDDLSYRTALELGAHPDRVHRVPDAVWSNPPSMFARSDDTSVRGVDGRLRVALNLNRDIANAANWDTFQSQLAAALALVDAEVPIELHGLPMQSRFKDHHDRVELENLFARLPGIPCISHDPHDHVDVAAIIASSALVVSERLHALVIAAILGTASVALMYDVKVEELVEQLGLTGRSVNVNAPFDPRHLADVMTATLADADREGRRLAERAEVLRHQTEDYFSEVRALVADFSGAPCASS